MSAARGIARGSASTAALLAGALAVSAIVVAIGGHDPFAAIGALFAGAFGSTYGLATTLTKSVPLLMTGLCVTIAFRAGFWNIGAEGQFVAGAIVAGWLGTVAGWPAGVHQAVVLAVAFVAGAIVCAAAAWLKLRRGTLEVISTILLNFVALYFLSWMVHGPLRQASGAQPIGDPVAASAELPRLLGPGLPLHAGFPIALGAIALGSVLLLRTRPGFRLRMVGLNPRAARWAGIDVDRAIWTAAVLSGGVAGAAGAIEVLGVLGRLFDKVSPGYGFTGIAVALLARLHPVALIPAALFFAALEAGSSTMQQRAGVSSVLVLVVQGVVILASAAMGIAGRRRGGA